MMHMNLNSPYYFILFAKNKQISTGRDEKVSLTSNEKKSVVEVDRWPDWCFHGVNVNQTDVFMVNVDQ